MLNLKEFVKKIDFDEAFPEVNPPDIERLVQNWKNLLEETKEKDDYYAALLYIELKKKGYKLTKNKKISYFFVEYL